MSGSFYRKAIKADFWPDDQLMVAGFQGGMAYITLANYTEMSTKARRRLQSWLVVLSIIMFILAIGMAIGTVAMASHDPWYSVLLGAALSVFFGYEFLLFTGFLRWTARHRQS